MSFDAKVTLNSLSFNDVVDANGTTWCLTTLAGWDSPALRQSFGAPTGRHGSVVLESMLDQRALTLSGICKATTEEFMWTSFNALSGQINNLVQTVDLTVYEVPMPKKIAVIRGGAVRMEILTPRIFTFEIPLIAPDPLKYSVAIAPAALSGTGTLTATGTLTVSSGDVLSGTGILIAIGVVNGFLTPVALTGSGSLDVTGVPAISLDVALAGEGTLAATGVAA